MSRNFNIVAAFVIVTASLAGGLSARSAHRRVLPNTNVNSAKQASAAEKYEADKVENDYREAITTVEDKYAGEIDYEKATQAAIQGMLFTLDPHSVFFSAADFKKLKEDQSSSFFATGWHMLRQQDAVDILSSV